MRTSRPPLRRVVAVIGSLLSLATALPGDDELRLYAEDAVNSEGDRSTACVWLAHGCRFRFPPPMGWSVKCQATNATLLLTHPDLKAEIGIVLHREPEGTNGPPDLAHWQRQAQSRYPQSTLQRESECTVAGREGWAFELAKTVGTGTAALVRVVMAPYPGGVAEFEMRTTAVHERMARRALRGVLSSLTIESVATEGSPRR